MNFESAVSAVESVTVEEIGSGFLRGAERRRGVRFNQRRPVKVFEPRSGKYLAGTTFDVSGTGLRIGLPGSAPVVEGLVLNVHVGVASGGGGTGGERLANRRSMVPARIVWVSRRGAGRDMTCGVEFVQKVSASVEAA